MKRRTNKQVDEQAEPEVGQILYSFRLIQVSCSLCSIRYYILALKGIDSEYGKYSSEYFAI